MSVRFAAVAALALFLPLRAQALPQFTFSGPSEIPLGSSVDLTVSIVDPDDVGFTTTIEAFQANFSVTPGTMTFLAFGVGEEAPAGPFPLPGLDATPLVLEFDDAVTGRGLLDLGPLGSAGQDIGFSTNGA